MKIVVACDSFKGSLSAVEACTAIADGLLRAGFAGEIVTLPLADGGEGTIAVLGASPRGSYAELLLPDGPVALIESAQSIGLHLPAMQAERVFQRSSASLGAALQAAIRDGHRRLFVALGGTATNDGGLGLLTALGGRFLDEDDVAVTPDLNGLLRLQRAEFPTLHLPACSITLLTDVGSPLLGPLGATHTFGPQKGVEPDRIASVEAAMARFADLCEAAFGKRCRNLPGAGAAGGLGFALQLLGGEVTSGADFVIDRLRLDALLADADWLITGEGRSDRQTLAGKLPLRAAELARVRGCRSALLSGAIDSEAVALLSTHFDRLIPAGHSLPSSSPEAARRLASAADRFARNELP